MKITDVKTFVVGNPWKNWLFVKVYTDEGITGLGESTGGLSTRPYEADVQELRRFVIDEDPLQPEALWQKMFKARYAKASNGMTGIELACWDILGKSLAVPVWKLLGGRLRASLRVYANGWYKCPRDPQCFATAAKALVEKGYTAMKFDPFGGAYLCMNRQDERTSIAIVEAVRETVGPDIDILIEAHDRFSVPYAVRIGTLLEPYDPMWLETPVHSADIEANLEVARRIRVPVALGERFSWLKDFTELLTARSVGIVQPEVMHLGFANLKKVCGMAEAYGALVACHQAQSPYCTAVNAHMHAVIPNFLIQENFDDSFEPWTWDVLSGVPRVQDGYLPVPDSPGFGVELNEEEAAKHPYGEQNFMNLFAEGWEQRIGGSKG